jgi:nucleolar protein 56
MQVALITKSPVGWFAFNEEGELIIYKLFELSEALAQYEGGMPEDFKAGLEGHLPKEDVKADRFLRLKIRDFAKKFGFAKTDAELNRFFADFATTLSRKNLSGVIGRDKLIIQATAALDDISRYSNGMLMRLSEWFGLHYPELKMSNEKLVDIVQQYGRREAIPGFTNSTGVALSEEDEETLRGFAAASAHALTQKKHLESYVKNSVSKLAPNFSSLVDPLLAARLLALAGSMEKLAKMSASTIQLIGAEKALFRHLRKQGKAPKFGLIFMSDWIQSAPEQMRGKVARAVASKLMMAARIDCYSGRNDSVKLRKELEEELAAIRDEGKK